MPMVHSTCRAFLETRIYPDRGREWTSGVRRRRTARLHSLMARPFGHDLSTLFAIVGTTYGNGDGSTTFNLPDKRGRVSVGLDTMGGVAVGRVTLGGSGINGATIGATGGGETYTMLRSDLPNIAPDVYGRRRNG